VTEDWNPELDDSPQVPPKPRKLPQQSRSRILFDSIKQACLMILETEGPKGLAVTRISELSGVAMGSIYQYFPNIDAIVATVYEDRILANIELASKRVGHRYRDQNLTQSLTYLIKGTLAFHQEMLALDEGFHRRFYQTFDLQRWFNLKEGDPLASIRVIREILEAHQLEYPMRDVEMEAFVITQAHRGTILDAVKYHPEYIGKPEFAQTLLNMALAVLHLPPVDCEQQKER
tara:strand:- start:3143 stop:3838 length:696 start_codon:yes stop_codon:yes gene_type:complete